MIRFTVFMIALTTFAGHAAAQTDTSFTYQGELKDNGGPASGSYDMSFSLWDAATDGVQIGSTIDKPGIVVTEGRFSAQLDMGANAFDNNSRWLEITVGSWESAPVHARTPITEALTEDRAGRTSSY